MWADEVTKCSYCHQQMSIIEAITEFGKWYHQDCMIHKLGAEIDDYKKKWIDGKLSKGDKIELLELFNLRQNMIADRTEFKGLHLVGETVFKRNMLTAEPIKQMACVQIGNIEGNFYPLKDETGNLIFTEDKTPTVEMRMPKLRPIVEKLPSPKMKLITMQELPKLLGVE